MATDRDEITGGLNQRGVFEYLDRECARSTDKNSELSCILFQLEGLEQLTEPLGLEKTLQAFYGKTIQHLRPYHMVGRIANSEFVVLLPEVSANQVEIIARRITNDARQITLGELPLTVRFGSATMTGCTADELLHEADASLYEAQKNTGVVDHHAS